MNLECKVGYSKGRPEMMRNVYEADPLICSRGGGMMKAVFSLTE